MSCYECSCMELDTWFGCCRKVNLRQHWVCKNCYTIKYLNEEKCECKKNNCEWDG